MNINRVTVGVDGGVGGDIALDWVIERARSFPTALELVSVVTPPEIEWDLVGAIRAVHEQILADAAERASRAVVFRSITTHLRTGTVARELIAASAGSDLLVVGTDKTSLVKRLVYGTVPLRLAALSTVPVVVVPKTWKVGEGPVVLAVGAEEPTATAVTFAADEAQRSRAALDLIHVWAAPASYRSLLSVGDEPWESLSHSAQTALDAAKDRVRAYQPGLPLRELLVEGPTVPRLIEASAHAQLLVVGREEHGALHDLVHLGSVAHDVLLNPAAPIAVIPANRGRALRAAASGSPASEVVTKGPAPESAKT